MLDKDLAIPREFGTLRGMRGTLTLLAVLAALNLAHELQQLRDEQHARNRDVERTLQDLHRKLDAALGAP